MKSRVAAIGLVIALSALTLACQQSETSISGSYGNGGLTGQVVMTGDASGFPPSGIEVRARGTGMTAVTDAGGRFEFAGLPEGTTELVFSRDHDGINATFAASANSHVVVELSRSSAKSRGRGAKHNKVELEGTVKSISATELVITDVRLGDVTVKIDERTIIRHGKRILETSDLAQGDQIHVRAKKNEDGSLTAVEIKLQEGEDEDGEEGEPTATANGNVKAVGADFVIVTTHDGREIKVMVNAQTSIRRQGTPITLADIREGDRIESKGTRIDDATILAKKIEIQPGKNNGRK